MTDRPALQDPRHQYPRPPFPDQPQSAPGLARRMDPRPDHGETSYRGSGRLQGRRALITGADSGIGRAAAIAYAREGADVALSYLPDEDADAAEVVALIEAEGRKAVAEYRTLIDEDCLAIIPAEPFLMTGPAVIRAAGEGARWRVVEIEHGRIARPQEGLIVAAYHARASRPQHEGYTAWCTTTYRRRGHEDWKVVQHQQTPES